MLRGRAATDDELAAMLAAAAARLAAARSDPAADGRPLSPTLPARARQLFDAGDEGAILLSFEPAAVEAGKAD